MGEHCGIVGISTRPRTELAKRVWRVWTRMSVPEAAFLALRKLKHRGQESSGLSFFDGKSLSSVKELGVVDDRLGEHAYLDARDVRSAIGHVRYSTSGEKSLEEAQPTEGLDFHLAFNGNISNVDELRKKLLRDDSSWKSKTKVDTEVIVELISRELRKNLPFKTAIENTMRELQGSFSAVLLTGKGDLYAFRDFLGTRPMVLGKLAGRYVITSESVALDEIRARLIREIKPGEIFHVNSKAGVKSYLVKRPAEYNGGCAHCVFEHIYFSHPLSKVRVNGRWTTVAKVRQRLGVLAAPELRKKVLSVIMGLNTAGYEVDAKFGVRPVSEKDVLVVGVPHSGLLFGQGVAQANGRFGWTLAPTRHEDKLPSSLVQRVGDVLKGLRYGPHVVIYRRQKEARTFISPGQAERESKADAKYGLPNADKAGDIRGKIVVLADDSTVRATTSKKLIEKFYERGALAVVFASSAPPIVKGCNRGIDTTDEELVVTRLGLNTASVGDIETAVAKNVGANDFYYGRIPHLLQATGLKPKTGYIRACLECLTRKSPEAELRKANAKTHGGK
ncbi:MAG: hypothetical protein V1811_03190 [Candidatus Micrarchaeota archaeon]